MKRLAAAFTSVLDFDPHCGCGNHAVAFLEMHAIDYCTEEHPTRCDLYCAVCLRRDVVRIVDVMLEHPDFCSTCGLTFSSLDAIIVNLSPLPKVRR